MVRVENQRTSSMFTVVAPTTRLSLDAQFIKRSASTFFVTVEGDGMAGEGILADDIVVVDRSRTPGPHLIVVVAIDGELMVRPFTAVDREDVHMWGVVSGVMRSLP